MLNKQQIAEKLRDSGLLGIHLRAKEDDDYICYSGLNDGETLEKADLPWPSADESEAILKKMKLQVLRTITTWELGEVRYRKALGDDLYFKYIHQLRFANNRTEANNEALAWLVDNKLEELKTAIEEVRGG